MVGFGFGFGFGWLVVSSYGLMEDDAVEMLHYYGFHLSSALSKISSPFRENYNLVVFPFLFHIFMQLTNLWFIRLQE